MKKYLTFIAAALLTACSSEELAEQGAVRQDADGTALTFSVYTPRAVTRAGQDSTITTASLKSGRHKDAGFGVFAYYTAGESFNVNATPNFMYNQQVKYSGGRWAYEPVKYWPNEVGAMTGADDVDRVSFFAYAPYVAVNATTGVPQGDALKNITRVSTSNDKGNPQIAYSVDTDPKTSVDLLWGVADSTANTAASKYTPLYSNAGVALTPGLPLLNLVKPAKADDAVSFCLRHALAKVKFTIDYGADVSFAAGTAPANSDSINAAETRVYVRSVTLGGFALQGVLDLNNSEAAKPAWLSTDGSSILDCSADLTFHDGRRDGREGTTNGKAPEANALLNAAIIENATAGAPVTAWPADKSVGVTAKPQPLFAGDATVNDGFFYVIPRNAGQGVDMEIAYDVLTIDPKVAGRLADNATPGKMVQQVLSQASIFGADIDIEAGKAYEVHIHLGMNSIKVVAELVSWDAAGNTDVDLPENSGSSDSGSSVTPPTYSLLSAAAETDCGKVVCASGHLHDAKTAVPAGCTAVGILGKVTSTGHGLILALQNAISQTFDTIFGWANVTYADTKLRVLPDDAARGKQLTSYTALGATAVSNWAVAPKSDYEAIFTNLGSTARYWDGQPYDDNVNAYITGAGGTALSGEYWSASWKDDYKAWAFYSVYWNPYRNGERCWVRPVLGF